MYAAVEVRHAFEKVVSSTSSFLSVITLPFRGIIISECDNLVWPSLAQFEGVWAASHSSKLSIRQTLRGNSEFGNSVVVCELGSNCCQTTVKPLLKLQKCTIILGVFGFFFGGLLGGFARVTGT